MEFYGQFDPPVDKVLYERYFQNKTHGISIEAGAFDGLTENSTKFFEKNLGWTTINIEPLPHIFEKLNLNRPESNLQNINLHLALSNKNDFEMIRVYDIDTYGIYNTNASLHHLDAHRACLESMSGGRYREYRVPTITYKDLIQKLNLTHVDLFVLDVEGYELQVLEGMMDCDVLPEVFVIEHGHREIGFFDPYLEKLKCPYVLDHTSHVNSFYVKKV